MLLLLSPAKQIDVNRTGDIPFTTYPVFAEEANELMLSLTGYDVTDIAEIFSINLPLAVKVKRYAYEFSEPERKSQAAILAYWGVAYKQLNAQLFSRDDLLYAQEHLRIGSGCYGLLRPFDAIKPYRMEFYTRLHGFGNSMQDFWRGKITGEIIKDLRTEGSNILVNIASNETFSSFDLSKLKDECRIITVNFQKITPKGFKSVSPVLAKQARGLFARYVIQNKIEDVSGLCKFEGLNMQYYEEGSTESNISFIHAE